MNDWLRLLFGLNPDEIPPDGDVGWELSGLPSGNWLLVALVLVAASVALIVLLYRRERGLGLASRLVLSSLRLGALALVIVVLLNPRVITEIHLERVGKTLVVVDTSASMQESDVYEGEEADLLQSVTGLDPAARPSRGELVRAALERQRTFEQLEESNRLQAFAVADGLEEVGDLEELGATEIGGGKTRLVDGVEEAVRRAGSELIAGVVLVSDGRSNAGRRVADVLRDPTGLRRVPVYAVGAGKSQSTRNFAVVDLSAPPTAEIGFPVQITARLRLSGIRTPVHATLRRATREGRELSEIDRRVVESTSSPREVSLKFIDTLAAEGVWRYTLELESHPEEVNTRDNVRTITVTAAEESFRLLLVSGLPTMEYRHLRNFFLRDAGIQVSCWLSSADPAAPREGDVVIRALPGSPEDFREYDVVLLLDPDPADLPAGFLEGLVDFVSHEGGGLAYVAGETFTPGLAISPRDTLPRLLPVRLDTLQDTGPGPFDRPWRARLTATGADHPICRLVNEADDNTDLWKTLPPFYFKYPTLGEKPGAVTLATGERGRIIAAIQQAGLGESLFLASDDFWRWRAARVSIHERFWAGVIRHLAQGKRRAGTREYAVETDRDRYTEGDRVQLFLQVSGRGPAEAPAPYHELRVERVGDTVAAADVDGPWTVRLNSIPGQAGRYGGFFRAEVIGEFAVRLDGEEKTSFKVMPVSTEWDDTSPDFAALRDLADASGGMFLPLAQLGSIPDRIPEARVREVIGRRAATVWDSSVIMLMFCGLLIVEWILRKVWHLT